LKSSSELNEVPTTPVVFTSADKDYFDLFAIPFVYSFSEMGHDIHIHIVNPDKKCYDLAKKLKFVCDTNITFSHEVTDMQPYRDHESVVDSPTASYYMCSRWFKMTEFLKTAGQIMIIDIDSLARKPFDFPKEDLGFYPRFYQEKGIKKVFGTIFYATEKRIKLVEKIKNRILSYPMQWFVDQLALYEELNRETEYFKFDDNFVDGDDREDGSDFKDNSPIWTGKGRIKWKHPQYLELSEYWKNRFQENFPEGENK